jgi:hypothetical protein
MIEILFIIVTILFGSLLYGKSKHKSVFQIKERFNPYSYQPIDYDNNVASIYGYKPDGYETSPKTTIQTCTTNDGLMGMNRWCEPCHDISTLETSTRRLIGEVNPRTLIAPQVTSPITDIVAWGTDNHIIHSAINDYRSNDLFLSGYQVLNNCECKGQCEPSCCQSLKIKENFNYLSPYDVTEYNISRPQILQNAGISTVAEKPLYTSITNGDNLSYIEDLRRNNKPKINYITGDEPSMIYDPRTVSYSDSNRAYVDKLLGQPKFYYDDINTARAPNYITRNKIDIYSFGESTGRLKDPQLYRGNNNQLAVEEFHNSTLLHRADLMQSLMNKRNREMWQLKEYPISTNGQRMPGGKSKI